MRVFIYRIIYTPAINFLLRNFLRLFESILPASLKISVSGTVEFKVKDGVKIKMVTNESCAAVNYLFWRGGPMHYEYSDIFIQLIQNCKVYFDVGSNVGYYTVLANAYSPSTKVYAFEPGIGPFHYLKLNVAKNNCKNARIFNSAISNVNGTIEFNEAIISKYTYLEHHLNGSSSILAIPGVVKKHIVPTFTLDKFVEENKIERIDLIKLDTEKTEHRILSAGHKTIERFKPVITCEVFDDVAGEVWNQVQELKYNIYYYKNSKLKKINHFSDVTEPGDRNFFLVPDEKTELIRPFISRETQSAAV